MVLEPHTRTRTEPLLRRVAQTNHNPAIASVPLVILSWDRQRDGQTAGDLSSPTPHLPPEPTCRCHPRDRHSRGAATRAQQCPARCEPPSARGNPRVTPRPASGCVPDFTETPTAVRLVSCQVSKAQLTQVSNAKKAPLSSGNSGP